MVDFKVVLSDPATGKAYNIDASGAGAGAFIGKRIGDEIDGSGLGFEDTGSRLPEPLTVTEHQQEKHFRLQGDAKS